MTRAIQRGRRNLLKEDHELPRSPVSPAPRRSVQAGDQSGAPQIVALQQRIRRTKFTMGKIRQTIRRRSCRIALSVMLADVSCFFFEVDLANHFDCGRTGRFPGHSVRTARCLGPSARDGDGVYQGLAHETVRFRGTILRPINKPVSARFRLRWPDAFRRPRQISRWTSPPEHCRWLQRR